MTIVADTNVWARAYLNDDLVQARKARKALADACSKGGVFVPLIVMAELAWVFRSRWDRDRVLSTLENLLQTRGVTVETPLLVHQAIDASRQEKPASPISSSRRSGLLTAPTRFSPSTIILPGAQRSDC